MLSLGAQGQVWVFPCVYDAKYEFLKSAVHTVVVQADQARARLRAPLAVPLGSRKYLKRNARGDLASCFELADLMWL